MQQYVLTMEGIRKIHSCFHDYSTEIIQQFEGSAWHDNTLVIHIPYVRPVGTKAKNNLAEVEIDRHIDTGDFQMAYGLDFIVKES